MIDYHIHTKLCGHATGEMEDYVRQAIKCELDGIGFSDHLPMDGGKEKYITMLHEELPYYVSEVKRLQSLFPEIRIKLGIEADYFPGNESYLKEILARYEFEYVIGSVHYIGKWTFDHPDTLKEWDNKDVDMAYKEYYELLRKSASTSLFDIIGHCDLVKKFGHRPVTDISKEVDHTIRVFKEYNVAIEINTSGLRKPVNEIYPSCDILTLCRRHGVPVVFGSDAHTPDDVGRDFDKAVLLARQAGFEAYATFEARRRGACKLDYKSPEEVNVSVA